MSGRNAETIALIGKAALAPSSHNTQPWRFAVSNSAVDLYADTSRALPVNDPEDRELIISCGCALMNLRIAAAEAGLAGPVVLFPDPDNPRWLARLSLIRSAAPFQEEAALAPFIETRRTHRQPFQPREVDASVRGQLVEAVQREGAWLRLLDAGTRREQVADLVAEGDARQWANPGWRRELAAWMGPPGRGEGLAVPTLAAPVTRWVVRTFNLGAKVGAADRSLAMTAPLLAVLGTDGDGRSDWLRAGQALEHLLLIACHHGLQASYLNQPVQVASLRPKLQRLAGSGWPQLLLRLGYPAKAPGAAPRRQVSALLGGAGIPS